MKKKKVIKKENLDKIPETEFYGTATVGTKGQIVIPQEARQEYQIKSGDKLVVFANENGVLTLIRASELNKLLNSLS